MLLLLSITSVLVKFYLSSYIMNYLGDSGIIAQRDRWVLGKWVAVLLSCTVFSARISKWTHFCKTNRPTATRPNEPVVWDLCFFGCSVPPPAKETQAESDTESDGSSAIVGNRPKSPHEKLDVMSKKERKLKSISKLRRSTKTFTNQNSMQKTDEAARWFSFLNVIKWNYSFPPWK